MRTRFESIRPDDYLSRLAASDLGRGYKAMAAAELDLHEGHTVVDLGCGPGADLPNFSAAVGPAGSVLGLDHDPEAVIAAGELTSALSNTSVRAGDAHRLDLANASVDRLHTDRVLQHVQEPQQAVTEVFRVLRPGGRAVFAEPDWGTLAIDGPDEPTTSAYQDFVVQKVIRNAWLGRQLLGLAERAGFRITRVIPVTAVFRDAGEADRVLGLGRVAHRAVGAGFLTESAEENWNQHLLSEPFFASVTLFVLVADRLPAGGTPTTD